VKYASVHNVFDYNRFARLGKWLNLFTKDIPYKLRISNPKYKSKAWLFLLLGFASLLFFGSYRNPVAAQQLDSMTPTATTVSTISNHYITVTYPDSVNVRSGPSSFDYPIIGSLPSGGTAPAIGRSPAGEWIQIEFPSAPRGLGWVYAENVSLSPGALLPVVEPPPTPAPLETPTLNPTYVAAFQTLPTSTRLPTFTAPPPLVIPTYPNPVNSPTNRNLTMWVIVILGLIGIAGLVLTSFRRHQG
jgi:hypothetical protein